MPLLEQPALRIGAVLEATDFHPGRSGRNHLRTLSAVILLCAGGALMAPAAT